MSTPTLDTSVMDVIRTDDGYYRFVDRENKLLTTGFTSEKSLKHYSMSFLGTADALKRLGNRYLKFYGND